MTSTDTGWDVVSESRSSAGAITLARKWSLILHSGSMCSTPWYSIQEAKPSFSQRSFHHFMVTRLPNHWWASSWATTTAIHCLASTPVSSSEYSKDVSL